MTVTTVRTWRGLAPRRRPKVGRRLDLRLLAPVAVAWLLTAFVGLLVDVRLVWAGSALALLLAGALVPGRWPARSRALRRLVALTLALTALLLLATAPAARSALPVRWRTSLGPAQSSRSSAASLPTLARSRRGPTEVVPSSSCGSRSTPSSAEVSARRCRRRSSSSGRHPRGGRSAGTTRSSSWLGSLPPTRVTTSWQSAGRSELREPWVAPARSSRRPSACVGASATATDHVWADARGLVPALVVGDTSRTPPDLTEAMLATGLSHVSAVSGTNVTLVVAAAVWACGLLGVPPALAAARRCRSCWPPSSPWRAPSRASSAPR